MPSPNQCPLTANSPMIYLALVTVLLICSQSTCEPLTWSGAGVGNNFEQLTEAINGRNLLIKQLVTHFLDDRFHQEERIRAEGNSGLVNVRNFLGGTQNFHTPSYYDWGIAGIHDHYGMRNVAGLGESTFVMNGVQFQTGHTDYTMVQADSQSDEFHATVDVQPPPVPQSVLDLEGNLEAQIAEMQEYFRAFQMRDPNHRPFEAYFKPVLCYMEGAWLTDTDTVVPPSVTADQRSDFSGLTWRDVHEQARMKAQTGIPTREQVPSLPRTIVGISESGIPTFAQWHYRVLCHPFEYNEIPQDYFRIVDDLATRVVHNTTMDRLYFTKRARFVLDEGDGPSFHGNWTLMDRLAYQIPGVGNGREEIHLNSYRYGREITDEDGQPLNAARYSRTYSSNPGGRPKYTRGFNDANLYVALTRNPKVAPMSLNYKLGEKLDRVEIDDLRATFMLPLEVFYLTPLNEWNPFNFPHYEGHPHRYPASLVRGKGSKVSQAANATSEALYYRTPKAFYNPSHRYGPSRNHINDQGIADRYFRDSEDNIQVVMYSGLTTTTTPIGNGVGSVRLRFPIMPLHDEGSAVWKELNALKVYLTEELNRLGRDITRINTLPVRGRK